MPKKIKFESGVHQFFRAARRFCDRHADVDAAAAHNLASWVGKLRATYTDSRFRISWHVPSEGSVVIPLEATRFYSRGDLPPRFPAPPAADRDVADSPEDPTEVANAAFFDAQFARVLREAGVFPADLPVDSAAVASLAEAAERRRRDEAAFHDEWAASARVQDIDVRGMNEACTAPEMRFIRQVLGNLRGRSVLDVGCGLGEASVYFALEGADVTASDISPGMLEAAQSLASANGVSIKTVLSDSEALELENDGAFDVVYIGNALHHVDIRQTMPRLVRLLKPGGVFVSWDPLRYNPVINVYRALATKVRTVDEHPLSVQDIRLIRGFLTESRVRYFWLTTLVIFVSMAVFQGRNPNKERYWKKVVEESEKWAWIYRPLESLDRCLLWAIPWLGLLCWNVVISGRRPVSQE